MRVIDLALKDLLQVVRDWKSALFLVIMPIVFTFFFGLIYGGLGGENDPRLPVGLVNHDQAGTLSAGLQNLLEASDAIRPVLLEGDEADKVADSVRDEDLAAAVVVPTGFSEQALAGEEARLTVIVDQSTQAGQTALNAVQAAMTRLLGTVQTAQISAEVYEAQRAFEDEGARQAYVDEALALASEAWQQPLLTVAVEQSGATSGNEEGALWNPYAHASAGMIVQFVVFGLNTSAMVLVLERKSRTLQRMLTTPTTRTEVIAGHVLAMFVVVFLQQVLLVAFGQLAFGVGYMREPQASFLMVVTLAFWAASLGLLISAISKGEDQVSMFSMLAMFVFSAMGGAWFPLDITGEAFATIGHLMPTAWAMDGFENIIVRGLGLNSVLLPAGILLAYAVVFFGLAVWRFRFE
ncbi:MAG: ABC transporter permease [Anaerolineae bacterium]